MRDLGAPHGKLPLKELSCPGSCRAGLVAESWGHGTVQGGRRGRAADRAVTQVTAEETLQPGPKTSSVLHQGNSKSIFLSTAGQLSFASFFAFVIYSC